MAGTADALQEGGNRPRRAQLAHQLDVADVDPQLQRRGSHQHPQLAAFEPLFGIQPLFARKTAVVGRNHRVAQPLAQMPCGPFGHPPGVYEDQRGAMFPRQHGQSVVDQLPDIVAHHRFQRDRRHLQGEVARPAMAHIDDFAVAPGANQEIGHRFDGLLCRRQPDTHQWLPAQRFQPLQR